MKKKLLVFLLVVFTSVPAQAVDLPKDLKSFFKKKYPKITFQIDNSFIVSGETFLPLIPEVTKKVKEIEIVYFVPDKNLPKLILLSNDWVFVKLIKEKNIQRIVNLADVSEQYREQFLKTKFPSDLVIPKGLVISGELSNLVGDLPIKIEKQVLGSKTAQVKTSGILYLTSPDTGKIVYLDLGNLSMIQHIQTMGAPWEIAFDKVNELLYVTDFAKDQLYSLRPMQNSIIKSVELPSMSSPKDIELSEDGSIVYILESLANNFAVYKTANSEKVIESKLPLNPTNFVLLKDASLIAITCPNENSLVFLNAQDFSIAGKTKLEEGPEEIISDSNGNTLYVANRIGNTVSVVAVNTKKVKSTIPVGETPTSLAIDPSGKWLYVGNGKLNSINIIDLQNNQIIDTIRLPIETQFPGDIKLTSDSKFLIVTSETTNIISIVDLDLKKVAVKLDVGATTHAAFLVNKELEKK